MTWPTGAVSFRCTPGVDRDTGDAFAPFVVAVYALTHARAVVTMRVVGEMLARRHASM